MEFEQMTTEEYNRYKDDDRFIHNIVYAVVCCDSKGEFKYKKAMTKYTKAKKEFIVNEEQINQAKKEYEKRKNKILENIKNKLVFVGMGMDFEPLNNEYIGNHRIRTYFLNNDGVLCFVEFGTTTNKDFLRVDHALMNIIKGDDENKQRISLEKLKSGKLEYTKKNILKLVNKYFNCSFKEVEVYNYFISTKDYVCKSAKLILNAIEKEV